MSRVLETWQETDARHTLIHSVSGTLCICVMLRHPQILPTISSACVVADCWACQRPLAYSTPIRPVSVEAAGLVCQPE